MISRRWSKVSTGRTVTAVAPDTYVRPEVEDAAHPPDYVEVFRLYEPIYRGLLHRLNRRVTRKVAGPLNLVREAGSIAMYQELQVFAYPPYDHATVLIFRDQGGYPRVSSDALLVTDTVAITPTYQRGVELGAADPTGTVPIEAKIGFGRTVALSHTVQAPSDPEITFEALMPDHAVGDLTLGAYVEKSLAAVIEDLREDEELAGVSDVLGSEFFERYGGHLEGRGELDVRIEPRDATVGPDEPVELSIELEIVRPGPTMVAICAQQQDGSIRVSDLIPISSDTDKDESVVIDY